MAFQISEEEAALIGGFVREYAGLVFSGAQEGLFLKRVKKRVEANRLATAREYYHLLRFGAQRADETRELINLLTVNETYFMREAPAMEMFSKEMLPALKERNRESRTLRIWSAACANGAEPYSLAMLIRESRLFDAGWTVDLYGTDINSEVLRAAREGLYTANAFRGMDGALKEKYFAEREPGVWALDDGIKRMVKFAQLNLHNPGQMKLMRGLDVIFCRNVLIYFGAESKKAAVDDFYGALNPLGFLVTGQAESLFKITTRYNIVPMSNVLLYQKPGPEKRGAP